jgi:hypothetical protein
MKIVFKHAAGVVLLAMLMNAGPACFAQSPATQPAAPSRAEIDAAIARGVKFLETSQTPDGFWGTGTVTVGSYRFGWGRLRCA